MRFFILILFYGVELLRWPTWQQNTGTAKPWQMRDAYTGLLPFIGWKANLAEQYCLRMNKGYPNKCKNFSPGWLFSLYLRYLYNKLWRTWYTVFLKSPTHLLPKEESGWYSSCTTSTCRISTVRSGNKYEILFYANTIDCSSQRNFAVWFSCHQHCQLQSIRETGSRKHSWQ